MKRKKSQTIEYLESIESCLNGLSYYEATQLLELVEKRLAKKRDELITPSFVHDKNQYPLMMKTALNSHESFASNERHYSHSESASSQKSKYNTIPCVERDHNHKSLENTEQVNIQIPKGLKKMSIEFEFHPTASDHQDYAPIKRFLSQL